MLFVIFISVLWIWSFPTNTFIKDMSFSFMCNIQKQPLRGVLMKRCSENMQQIYRRTPMPSAISIKLLCNFMEITLRHGCSPVNFLHIFRKPFLKNTSEGLLQDIGIADKILFHLFFDNL